jgi:hypothetical protein
VLQYGQVVLSKNVSIGTYTTLESPVFFNSNLTCVCIYYRTRIGYYIYTRIAAIYCVNILWTFRNIEHNADNSNMVTVLNMWPHNGTSVQNLTAEHVTNLRRRAIEPGVTPSSVDITHTDIRAFPVNTFYTTVHDIVRIQQDMVSTNCSLPFPIPGGYAPRSSIKVLFATHAAFLLARLYVSPP